jgi:hypothetical protein
VVISSIETNALNGTLPIDLSVANVGDTSSVSSLIQHLLCVLYALRDFDFKLQNSWIVFIDLIAVGAYHM